MNLGEYVIMPGYFGISTTNAEQPERTSNFVSESGDRATTKDAGQKVR